LGECPVKLTWDEVKRQITLEERGLDFTSAAEVFDASNFNYTTEDVRYDYGEKRFISFGFINNRLCVVVWTPRGKDRHIISMRKANDREQKDFEITIGSR
jgi:uncharacterized DUF497 family protein